MAGGEYKISKHWAFAALVQYDRRLSIAADSPVVQANGSADRIISGAFAMYTF